MDAGVGTQVFMCAKEHLTKLPTAPPAPFQCFFLCQWHSREVGMDQFQRVSAGEFDSRGEKSACSFPEPQSLFASFHKDSEQAKPIVVLFHNFFCLHDAVF